MKVTTATCVAELNRRFPTELGANAGGWKRISKRGAAPADIVRVFEHRTLDVSAIIVENGGCITTVTFGKKDDPALTKSASAEKPPRKKCVTPPTVEPSPKAKGYFWAVSRRMLGLTYFAVVKVEHWRKTHHLGDDCLMNELGDILPEDCGEDSESQFVTKLTVAKLRAFMMARGFAEDEDFTQFMADLY